MNDKFKDAMIAAQAELEELEERRKKLLLLIEALRAASGDERLELEPPPGYVPQGLTEEIRTILRLTTVHLDPVQIRDSLLRRGFSSMTPRNLLISVHTVLSRLHDARELDEQDRDGKTVYKMKTVILGALAKALLEPTKEMNEAAAKMAAHVGEIEEATKGAMKLRRRGVGWRMAAPPEPPKK